MVVLSLLCFTLLIHFILATCPVDLPVTMKSTSCTSAGVFTMLIKEDVCYRAPFDTTPCDTTCCEGADYETCMSCTGALTRTGATNSFIVSNGSLFLHGGVTTCSVANPIVYSTANLVNGCRFNYMQICDLNYADYRQAMVDSECPSIATTTTGTVNPGGTTSTSGTASPGTTSTTGSTEDGNGSRSSSPASHLSWLW